MVWDYNGKRKIYLPYKCSDIIKILTSFKKKWLSISDNPPGLNRLNFYKIMRCDKYISLNRFTNLVLEIVYTHRIMLQFHIFMNHRTQYCNNSIFYWKKLEKKLIIRKVRIHHQTDHFALSSPGLWNHTWYSTISLISSYKGV